MVAKVDGKAIQSVYCYVFENFFLSVKNADIGTRETVLCTTLHSSKSIHFVLHEFLSAMKYVQVSVFIT